MSRPGSRGVATSRRKLQPRPQQLRPGISSPGGSRPSSRASSRGQSRDGSPAPSARSSPRRDDGAEPSPAAERKKKVKEILQAFAMYDTSGDGTLDFSEFRSLMLQGSVMSELQLKALFGLVDKDGNGRIEFEEFVSFVFEPPELPDVEPPAGLLQAYMAHAGRDGLMDGGQFAKFCKTFGLISDKRFARKDADIVFTKSREGNVRKINFEHFQHALVSVALKKGIPVRDIYDAIVPPPLEAQEEVPEEAPAAAEAEPCNSGVDVTVKVSLD